MKKTFFLSVLLGLLTFNINAYGQDLAAHAAVTTSLSSWSYSIFNDEGTGDPNFLTSFNVDISAPVTAITSPDGWAYNSDNQTYVYWYNTDPSLPYPHDVAPGASLGGFTFQSTALFSTSSFYGISAWNHPTDSDGLGMNSNILSPSTNAPVPEASTFVSFGFGLLLLGGIALIARKRARKTA